MIEHSQVPRSCPARHLAVALVLLVFHAGAVQAAWLLEPSLELTTGYEDNVRLAPDEEEDAIVSTVTAQARFRNLTEISEVAGLLGGSYLNYANTDDEDLDDEDTQFLSFLARRDTERSRFGLEVDGRRSLILRRVDPISGLLDGPDDDLDEVEDPAMEDGQAGPIDDDIDVNATSEQFRRTYVRAEPFIQYQLGPLTTVGLAYQHAQRSFDSDGESQGLRDTTTNGIEGELNRTLTERTTLGVSLGATRFEGDGLADEPDQEVDNYTAAVGFDHQLSEQVSVGADIGASRTENKETDNEDTNLTYRLRLTRDLPVSRLSAYAQRTTEPSGFGGVVTADRVSVRYQRSLRERLELSLTGYGYRTQQVSRSENSREERDYLGIEPRLTWRFSEAWNGGMSYRYRWADRDYDDEFAGTADSHSVSLFLIYQPPTRL